MHWTRKCKWIITELVNLCKIYLQFSSLKVGVLNCSVNIRHRVLMPEWQLDSMILKISYPFLNLFIKQQHTLRCFPSSWGFAATIPLIALGWWFDMRAQHWCCSHSLILFLFAVKLSQHSKWVAIFFSLFFCVKASVMIRARGKKVAVVVMDWLAET